LEEVHLMHRATHLPAQLSGGEMQRVAIARAISTEPELLVADEPTGSLDTASGLRVLELLSELNRSRRMTILLATHSSEAATFASRKLNIRDGRLEESLPNHVTRTPV
jgi:putative ABC transport system ATP-binding protein